MFTVEHLSEDTVVRTLDQEGRLEDVELIIDDTSVFLRQWQKDRDCYEVIEMSSQQFKDILAAMNTPEGAYYGN
jgi:hypothetical protein